MNRRDFIKAGSWSAAALTLGRLQLFAQSGATGAVPKRPFGKTGIELSVVGFGGIIVRDALQSVANRSVAQAVERGVNYFDVAPNYGDAEIKLGPALEPYRKNCFLACKTQKRDYASAKEEFHRSLERLRTDYFDLYQLHAITDVEKDVEAAFADDGAMKLLREAKKDGRIHHLGFSAHSQEAAFRAMELHDFDSILFPVNFAAYLKGDFGEPVVKAAAEKGMAVLALKVLARQHAPKEDPIRQQYPKCWYQPVVDPEEARLAMSFTLNQPVTSVLPPGEQRLFDLALDSVPETKKVSAAEFAKIREICAQLDKPIFAR
ncbi:MAG: aldo/keto reductase [Chthoniobacterales bacterium]